MKKSNLFIISILIVLGCNDTQKEKTSRVANLPYYNEATFTPKWFSSEDKSLDTFHKISSFKLINQDSQVVSEKSFADKIYIVDFFFTTCPGICPKMTANMGLLQDEFLKDDEILLLSHSVTPKRDSVPVLKAYAESKDVISGKWHLVTGSLEEIYGLGRNDYFIEEDLGLEMEEDDFLHTENFVLIDKDRHLRGIYNGLNSASIKQLIADVQTLKKEQS